VDIADIQNFLSGLQTEAGNLTQQVTFWKKKTKSIAKSSYSVIKLGDFYFHCSQMEAGQSVSYNQINAVIHPATLMLNRLNEIKDDTLYYIQVMYEKGPVTLAAHDATGIVPQLQQLTIAIQSSAADA
jgi:hypothetical protein